MYAEIRGQEWGPALASLYLQGQAHSRSSKTRPNEPLSALDSDVGSTNFFPRFFFFCFGAGVDTLFCKGPDKYFKACRPPKVCSHIFLHLF